MAFDHNRRSGSHSSGDSFWTSYSDLFLGLSTIFLLLYVTASLRTGTDAIKSQVDNQKLSMQVEELRSQLKMYEQVKADYMKDASKDEVQEYNELMDKLTLLKEEAKSDKERLAMESLENDKKAQALTKYQQMIRNVINANKVAKTKIINRNTVIDEQDVTIDQQKSDITNLASDVEQKKNEIAEQNRKIASAKQALDKNKKKLVQAYKSQQITKKQLEARTLKLQQEAAQKIQQMQAVNKNYSQQLNQLSSELQNTQSALSGTQQQLAGTKQELEGTQQALNGTQQKLAGTQQELSGTKSALSAKEQEAANAAAAASAARGEAAAAAAAANAAKGEAAAAKGQVAGLSGQLAKAREELDARREIAREIKKGFQAAGVKADVDMQTGEVVLDFGDSYFESGSANLKPKMIDVIEKAMPAYSKSLFGNAKIANKITTVEVVGFASPTYKGRFVDPRSNKPDDKAALKYNMDLSYQRANSIFHHLVNNKEGDFAHQQDLLSLMKVSGRSFLEVMKVQGRSPASAAEFCKVNDCKKAQKVIVRFSMDGKK